MDKIILDINSPKEQYGRLFSLKVGEVFKVNSDDYETVMERINEYLPDDLNFEVFPITPGTDLYTMYGPCHCVVTLNEKL